MAKEKEYQYQCDNPTCGEKYVKWARVCRAADCDGELVEYTALTATVDLTGIKSSGLITPSKPAQLIKNINADNHSHQSTGVHEFDRVLGGGLIPGGTIILAGPPGTGKALALDTLIFTSRGWRLMKDLKVNDLVLGLDGKFTKIVALSEVWLNRPVYSMTFNEETIEADEQHEWVINTLEVLQDNADPIIKTTKEIFDVYKNSTTRYSFHRAPTLRGEGKNYDDSVIIKENMEKLVENAFNDKHFNLDDALNNLNYEDIMSRLILFEMLEHILSYQTFTDTEEFLEAESKNGLLLIQEILHLLNYKTEFKANPDNLKQEALFFKNDELNRSVNNLRSIKKVESVPVMCIEVDNESHTYLAGRTLIPTHNSSLLAHVSHAISQESNVLYVSGEESVEQIKLRHKRMNAEGKHLYLAAEQDLSKVLWQIEQVKPKLLIIDSMQTIASSEVPGSQAGSITQVNLVAQTLVRTAKSKHIPIIFVGHYTKDGNVAGPRTVEHLVDVVLGFEGEQDSPLRLLRGIKNRYGPSDEIGCFQHTETGLEEVSDPSGLLMGQQEEDTIGVMSSIFLEGNRALPIEIQSLVVVTGSPNPKRSTIGLDNNKTIQMQAILQKYGAGKGTSFANHDIYVQVIGGMTVKEPAVDLATIVSIASSRLDVLMPKKMVAIGLVSVSGEIRQATGMTKRLKEASRLGFKVAIVPLGTKALMSKVKDVEDMTFIEMKNVTQVIDYLIAMK